MNPAPTPMLRIGGRELRACVVTRLGAEYRLPLPPGHMPIALLRDAGTILLPLPEEANGSLCFSAEPADDQDPSDRLPLILAVVPHAALAFWMAPPAGVLDALFAIADRAAAAAPPLTLH